MTEIEFSSEMDVELIQHMGDDSMVAHAALVSTKGDLSQEPISDEKKEGLINFLVRERHGSTTEHCYLTFRISAPIFVFREFHRHRIGWNYNEESGRYTQLKPKFYIPDENRALRQIGKPGAYEFIPGTEEQKVEVTSSLTSPAVISYQFYEHLIDEGVAKEVARMSLPLNTYSTMYATCNLRSLMHFLGLRTKRDNAKFPSYPQREIEMVAEKMEEHFKELFPITYRAFEDNGRVAP